MRLQPKTLLREKDASRAWARIDCALDPQDVSMRIELFSQKAADDITPDRLFPITHRAAQGKGSIGESLGTHGRVDRRRGVVFAIDSSCASTLFSSTRSAPINFVSST